MSKPMRQLHKKSILVFLFLATSLMTVWAQEDYDFRRYKFYDDEEWWWRPAIDSVGVSVYSVSDIYNLATEARYALAGVRHNRRGEGEGEDTYLGRMRLGYSSSRLLRSLGHYGQNDGRNVHLSLGKDRYMQYRGQRLRLNLSGRNEWGSMTHRATYGLGSEEVRLRGGWQLTHYARVRTGRDIYVEGVAANGVDLALDVVRQKEHSTLSIIALVPWSERGMREASTEEAYRLMGDKRYNPAWGVQSGRERSGRVRSSLHPEAIVTYQRRLSLATTLTLSGDVGFERSGREALAWFNAPTPAPDNYRYMPSYYDDDIKRRAIEDAWQRDDVGYTQIDWASLYHTNALQRDGHAVYAVDRQLADVWHAGFDASLVSRIGDIDLEYGVVAEAESERRYKRMHDLMGATHIIDLDYYLEDDATLCRSMQNDHRCPNRRVEEGDSYGYDYRLQRLSGEAFIGAKWSDNHMSWGVEAAFGGEVVRRCGLYEKELFPGAGSYGASRAVHLSPYRVAAEWSYNRMSHLFEANLSLRGESPTMSVLFLNPDYNNRTTTQPRLSHHMSASLSYAYMSQMIKVRATLFAGSVWGVSRMVRYYDDLSGLFSDADVSNLGYLNLGVEVDMEVEWSQYFSSSLSLTACSSRHSRDGWVRLYDDADNHLIAEGRTAMKGMKNATPAFVGYGDIEFSRGGWQAQLSAQCFVGRYVEPSPIRRMMRYSSLKISDEELSALTQQQRLGDTLGVNLSLGKSFRLEDYRLIARLGVDNIFGTDYVAYAYEQHRVRITQNDGRASVRPFDNMLLYAYPRTYQLSVSLSF